MRGRLRGCEPFHPPDLILRSPSEARASRRMAASPNLLPWFETARCARLLTMRPSVLEVSWRAQAHALAKTQSSRSARLEGWAATDLDRPSNVRKSGGPDLRCSRRRARGCGIRGGPRLRLLTMKLRETACASN